MIMQNVTLPIVVFCHLRWDFVHQRPQHLLSRLARTRGIIFIEEPIHKPQCQLAWEKLAPEPNVLVCRTCVPEPAHGFDEAQVKLLQRMVPELLEQERIEDYVLWLYTPMAAGVAEALRPRALIFDVMDELSKFAGAPRDILEREAHTLELADLVFTGGPSLYRAKKDRHPSVYCFPSSVDAAHYAKAKNAGIDAADQAELPHPRLGFFGVIDERFDAPLLDAAAAARPNWQFCMVGPVVKIDPATLPRRSNIHYFGQRTYTQLPEYLAGWDVALLPFARNESTRFISPTKTLEYMAAEKPIVSTPITDVAEPYGDIVYLADTAGEFVAACERALGAPESERRQRAQKMWQVLARTSWDRTVENMSRLIEQAVAQRDADAGRDDSAILLNDPLRRARGGEPVSQSTPVLVIGAGPTGLSAAYHLGADALLLEKNDRVGGWCRSVVDNGFTFDMAGHIMFSKDPYVHEMYKLLLGENIHWQDREAWIFSKGVYTRYPFQGCLYGLPVEVVKECIIGAIEARFGSLKPREEMKDAVAQAASHTGATPPTEGRLNGNGQAKAAAAALNGKASGNGKRTSGNGRASQGNAVGNGCDGDIKDCCGDGILEAEAPLVEKVNGNGHAGSAEPENFEEFIYKVWGKGIARHFAIPYNRKLWAVDLKEMETSWLGGRVPMPDIEEMILYALTPAGKPMGPNARFGYPLRGGFQALMNGFLPHVKQCLRLNTGVRAVSPSRHVVTLQNGSTIRYDQLISTMPLPLLITAMGDEAPHDVRQAAAGLRHINVRCVNIGVGREKVSDKHWIYYPEDTVFHRIFVQGNASPHCNPPGGFGFTCEITYGPQKPLPCDGQELIDLCLRDARRVGFIRGDDPIWCGNQVDMPCAYVVYDHSRPRFVKLIRDWLAEYDIVLAGRYSEWEYYNSDHAFVAGKRAAEQVRELRAQRGSGTTRRGVFDASTAV